jgi:hypothetical protein
MGFSATGSVAVNGSESNSTGNMRSRIVRRYACGANFFPASSTNEPPCSATTQALDWQGALITECADHPATRLRILAFWCDGSFLDDFEYDLAGTACEEVICNDAPFFVATGVGERYPKEAGWQAYLGLPIRSGAGEVLGHLALVDRRKMSAEVLQMPIYQSFIARAASEIERRHQLHAQSAPTG